jgi:hypothetical protein
MCLHDSQRNNYYKLTCKSYSRDIQDSLVATIFLKPFLSAYA